MNGSTKTALVAAMFLVALGGGLYLSGQLTLMLLGVDIPLTWRTWWDYHSALVYPEYAPYAWKIKAAGVAGFGLPALGWIGFLVLLLRSTSSSRSTALHGDARFATRRDLEKQGLLKESPDGIVVGKFGRKLIRLSGQQFVILAAPTRSGKGVGVVIPNLLEYQGSIVVLDIKQENFDLTSGWRKSQDQQIFLFNPFAEDRRTHRWNPLSYVSPDPAFRISDIQSIGAMLYPDGSGDQKFWISQARNAFTAFTLYLFESFDEERKLDFSFGNQRFPTLGEVYRLSTGDGGDLRRYLHRISTRSFLSDDVKTAFANLLSQADDTFASIMGSFKEPLNAWINPVLDAATSCNDFLLTDVRKKKMTIYIGIQPNKLAESRLIVNLFFSQLINVNTRELPQTNPELKYQCLLLMDEFTAIGKVDILASSVSYMAGYNLRLLPIIQSMAQLDATYGKDVSRTIITNHALQIIFAPREQQDANDYSDMLGYTTVSKESVSKGRDVSRSRSDERRALMLPQELKAMGSDKEVILYEGIAHPVKCEKIKYYDDKRFKARLLPRIDIPELVLKGDKQMEMKTNVIVAAGVALAAMTQAAVAEPATARSVSIGPAPAVPYVNAAAQQAADRFLAFVVALNSTADISKAKLEEAFQEEMLDGEDGSVYISPLLSDGWIYAVERHAAKAKFKQAFEFGFYNGDRSADPSPVCVLDLAKLCPALAKGGYAESVSRADIGGVTSINFAKNDLVLTIVARDIMNSPDGRECVRAISSGR